MKLRKAVKAWAYKNSFGNIEANQVLYLHEFFKKEQPCIVKFVYPEADSEGWIPTALRKPTKMDADNQGKLIAAGNQELDWWGKQDWETVKDCPDIFTHWQPAPRPPQKKLNPELKEFVDKVNKVLKTRPMKYREEIQQKKARVR